MLRKRYKRDYMILESKDPSFRLKERISPKAFAKIETREEKVNIMIYVENVKYIKSGYRIILIQDDLTAKDIGRVLVNENGKGEFKINFDEENLEVKGIALTHEKDIPLIGFKGKMIDNYEELINKNIKRKESVVEDLDKEDELDKIPDLRKEKIKFELDEKRDYEEEEIEEEKEEEIEQEEQEEETEEEIEENYDTELKQEEIERNEKVEEKVENEKKKNEEKILFSQKEKIEEKTEQKMNDSEEQDVDRKESRKKDEKVYLIPRKLKKLLKKHKEIKPFIKEIDNTRWWKIDINPLTMCSYIMPYLGYINYINYTIYSDITSLSYKYRHYIFGIKYSCDGKRKYYIYGIPGRRNEQPDEGETGFCNFIPCDDKNKTYGYWICCIDCKSRLIAVADK